MSITPAQLREHARTATWEPTRRALQAALQPVPQTQANAKPAGRPGTRPTASACEPDRFRSKWEWQYAQHLQMRVRCGEVLWWQYEPVKLPLAKGAGYTPDFLLLLPTGWEFHEVKGWWREAARVRWKVAIEKYPHLGRFCVVKRRRGGGWDVVQAN